MTRKVAYWVSTGLLAALSIFTAFTYLLGNPQTAQEFARESEGGSERKGKGEPDWAPLDFRNS